MKFPGYSAMDVSWKEKEKKKRRRRKRKEVERGKEEASPSLPSMDDPQRSPTCLACFALPCPAGSSIRSFTRKAGSFIPPPALKGLPPPTHSIGMMCLIGPTRAELRGSQKPPGSAERQTNERN